MNDKMTIDSLLHDKKRLEDRYNIAAEAEVGTEIECPCCEKVIVKRRYNTKFCSNVRTHGKGNCKDRFWNALKGIDYHIKTMEGYNELK